MKGLRAKIESLLFVSSKPLTIKRLAKFCQESAGDTKQGIEELSKDYSENERGMIIVMNGETVQLATNPTCSDIVQHFLNEERQEELTKPSLETLTVIAYRAPILKSELELIRGVNCGLILRNLQIRGLIDIDEHPETKEPLISVSLEFLKYLGLSKTSELPDYERLSRSDMIEYILSRTRPREKMKGNNGHQ